MSSTTIAKKNKGKKVADPNETSKLLAAKISQLEQDAAGEKDQEQEIGMWLFRACGSVIFFASIRALLGLVHRTLLI
jgi:hypothetical protein